MLSSVGVLREHAYLINQYINNDTLFHLNLKNKSGKVNHRQLNEKLFELYVGNVFSNKGFQVSHGESYADDDNCTKPIDVAVLMNNELVLCEVTKVTDPFKDEALRLARKAIILIQRLCTQYPLKPDELFSGTIAVKERDIAVLKSLETVVNNGIKDYLFNVRNPVQNVVTLSSTSTSKEYDFNIGPAFMDQMNPYSTSAGHELNFHFNLSLNHRTRLVRCNVKLNINSTDAIQNNLLIQRIENKIRQHKSFKGQKIITVGIEQFFTTHSKGSSPLIQPSQVDQNRIKQILPPKTDVLLLFREITEEGFRYQSQYIPSGEQALSKSTLTNLTAKDLLRWCL